MEGGAIRAQRQDGLGVIAIDEGDGGDRPGLDHHAPCPGEQHRQRPAIGPREEMIFAAPVRMGGGKLRIAQGTGERDDAAQQPGAHERRLPAHIGGHQRGRLEDADAEDDAHHEGDAIHDR